MIFELAQDFRDAAAAMPADHPKHRMLELLEEAVRRDIHFIDRHPTTLFQCMWNTCWWYCREAHDTRGWRAILGTILRGLVKPANPSIRQAADAKVQSLARQALGVLLTGWRDDRTTRCIGIPWLRSMNPPLFSLNTGLKGVFRTSRRHSGDGTRTHGEGGQAGFHTDPGELLDVALTFDGGAVAAAGRDGHVHLWDARNGAHAADIAAHCTAATAVRFLPGSDVLVSGGDDGVLAAHCAWTGRCLWSLAIASDSGSPARITCLAVSDRGGIAAGTETGHIVIVDAGNPTSPRTHRVHPNRVTSLGFTGEGVISTSWMRLCVTDPRNGALVRSLDLAGGNSPSAAVLPGNRIVASVVKHRTFRSATHLLIWAAGTVAGRPRPKRLGPWEIECLRVSPDGRRIAMASGRMILVYDAVRCTRVCEFEGHTGCVTALAWAADSNGLFSSSRDGSVRHWECPRGDASLTARRRSFDRAQAIAYDAARDHFVVASSDQRACFTLTLWDSRSGRRKKSLNASFRYGVPEDPSDTVGVTGITVRGGGRFVRTQEFIRSYGDWIRVWDIDRDRELEDIGGRDLAMTPEEESAILSDPSSEPSTTGKSSASGSGGSNPEAPRFRAMARRDETVFTVVDRDLEAAWWQERLTHLTSEPSGTCWAGVFKNVLRLLCTEEPVEHSGR